MKNRNITHAREQVEIYKDFYQPSFNPLRFMKSILGVLLFGSSSVAQHPGYAPLKRKRS
jgi:hypothetical protein